ncbi:MAG: hypothetical protein JW775_05190 [Candidatus Aminicenantes bacterium]|nr:hypothetical protein [Candidatus Aminicenantes bacterium]
MGRAATLAVAAALLAFLFGPVRTLGQGNPPRPALGPSRRAVEIAVPANEEDEALLGRPVALAFDGGRLYVADALDCAVKVFSKDGRFLKSFGRKGSAPGELSFPSGVCVAGEAVAVADKFNLRIQLFDKEGRASGGFRVPFAPDRVLAPAAGRLLVTGNPTGRLAGERLLHVYDLSGRLEWEGLEARSSSDPVLDAFRNMILVCPGEEGDFYVVFRSGERVIRRFAGSGRFLGEIAVDERHAVPSVDMPLGRRTLRLSGFCWAASRDQGVFFLSAPEAVAGKDLGPGRAVSVIGSNGRLQDVIELPCAVHRFVVAGGRMFAIDDEGALRIFEVRS